AAGTPYPGAAQENPVRQPHRRWRGTVAGRQDRQSDGGPAARALGQHDSGVVYQRPGGAAYPRRAAGRVPLRGQLAARRGTRRRAGGRAPGSADGAWADTRVGRLGGPPRRGPGRRRGDGERRTPADRRVAVALPPLVTLAEFGTWVGEDLTGDQQAAMILDAA